MIRSSLLHWLLRQWFSRALYITLPDSSRFFPIPSLIRWYTERYTCIVESSYISRALPNSVRNSKINIGVTKLWLKPLRSILLLDAVCVSSSYLLSWPGTNPSVFVSRSVNDRQVLRDVWPSFVLLGISTWKRVSGLNLLNAADALCTVAVRLQHWKCKLAGRAAN